MCLYVPLAYRYISLATKKARKWSFKLKYYELEEDIDVIYPTVSFYKLRNQDPEERTSFPGFLCI